MKIEFLGFLPLIIILIWVHVVFLREYKKGTRLEAMNQMIVTILIIFYIVVTMTGFIWGLFAL